MADITVRITPTVADEYVTREIPERPFSLITNPGTYSFSPAEAQSLLGDADYYSSTDGPGGSLTFGQRRAYAALANQLRKAGVTLSAADAAASGEPVVPIEDADLAPETQPYFAPITDVVVTPLDESGAPIGAATVALTDVAVPEDDDDEPVRPVAVAVGTLPPGTEFQRSGTTYHVAVDQAGVSIGRVRVAGAQSGLVLDAATQVLVRP